MLSCFKKTYKANDCKEVAKITIPPYHPYITKVGGRLTVVRSSKEKNADVAFNVLGAILGKKHALLHRRCKSNNKESHQSQPEKEDKPQATAQKIASPPPVPVTTAAEPPEQNQQNFSRVSMIQPPSVPLILGMPSVLTPYTLVPGYQIYPSYTLPTPLNMPVTIIGPPNIVIARCEGCIIMNGNCIVAHENYMMAQPKIDLEQENAKSEGVGPEGKKIQKNIVICHNIVHV